MTGRLRLVEQARQSERFAPPADSALLGGSVSYPPGSAEPVSALSVLSLAGHRAALGSSRPPVRTAAARQALIDQVATAGLTGHGGGHFPVAKKWKSLLRNASGGGSVLVGNGAESEPGSVKDRALLEYRPHLVLDGLACVAELIEASEVVLWLHEGSPGTHRAVAHALAERREAGLDEPAVRVVLGPDRYLSGESSAIVSTLSGGPTLPRFRRDPATRDGVGGRPTLVHNVETLARVARLARHLDGGSSTLLSICHDGMRSAVEVDCEASLDEVLLAVTGLSASQPPQAVLIGGYGGSWCSWQRLVGTSAHEYCLQKLGISLGAGVLLPASADECGLRQSAAIADYLAAGSARQCGPCLFGLRAVADLLAELVDGRPARRDVRRLQAFLDQIEGRGGCHHPDGAVRMVSSAIATFADDVASHLRRGRCLHADRAPYVPIAQALR